MTLWEHSIDTRDVATNKNSERSKRPRRLRASPTLRSMVRETRLTSTDLIYPLFVTHGFDKCESISSMPGVFRWSTDRLLTEVAAVRELGVPAVLMFGIPSQKDAVGSGAYADDGVVQQAVQSIKEEFNDLVVITDTCLCEYTDHGHCGVIRQDGDRLHADPYCPDGYVLNDETLELLAHVAVSQAAAGADVVAPSGMMDGMVGVIRSALDTAGYERVAILSYAAKYASAFYGPFREAADGAPKVGDRRSHQMDPANGAEAMKEIALDVDQGADMVMVKPAMSYLDIVRRAKEKFPEVPVVAYNVSGEYALVKAASANGWVDERATTLEILTSMKRAGANAIVTYHAKDVAGWLAGR